MFVALIFTARNFYKYGNYFKKSNDYIAFPLISKYMLLHSSVVFID